jgi:transcription elongation factor SPT5
MFKDGFLYKRVALSSLIYWGIQPTDIERVKFSSSPSTKTSADDMEWVSSVYGHKKKRNVPREPDMNASSSSKDKCSKASNLKGSSSSNLKGSSSNENYEDDGDDDAYHLHDLVLFG